MKIGISCYVGPRKTGIGRTLENILSQCSNIKDDHQFYLFHNKDNQDFKVFSSLNFTKKKVYISRKNSLLNFMWHQGIYQLRLLWNNLDVVYIPNVTLLLWKVRPTVVVIHDLIEFNVPDKFSKWRMLYRRIAIPITAKRSDFIIVDSENSKRDLMRYCKVPKEKIKVIYHGVDPIFKPLDINITHYILKKYRLEFPYILCVGTIDHPGKNSISLIRAFKKISSQFQEFKLVLVGKKGFGFEKIESEVNNLNLKDKVHILGYISDEDLIAIYNGASVFAFLSLYEGFGLPLIEAMACGTPVITANTSCLYEIVGDAGFIVEPYDIDKIAEYLEILITNENVRRKMILKGFERAQKFSWVKSAKQVLNVLEEVYTFKKDLESK